MRELITEQLGGAHKKYVGHVSLMYRELLKVRIVAAAGLRLLPVAVGSKWVQLRRSLGGISTLPLQHKVLPKALCSLLRSSATYCCSAAAGHALGAGHPVAADRGGGLGAGGNSAGDQRRAGTVPVLCRSGSWPRNLSRLSAP